MDELKTLGKNIRRLRRSADLTQSELGLKIDLSKDTLSKLELGKQENIGMKHLILICRELGADMEQLFVKDAKSFSINITLSDGNARAIGEIVEQVKKILTKKGD